MIFQSFQSGNLKQLDLEFYLRLRLPTTKRMYRFLDKRFYRRSRLDFDLRTLACEHIGLSRSYAPTELKRRLKPALEELEQLGFLEPLSPEERYSYVKRGCWRIIFIRGQQAAADVRMPPRPHDQQPTELVEASRRRGITAKTAQELVETHPHEPDPHQDRGLRLVDAQRGQAGRQEPRRLPGRLDPSGLSGSWRLSDSDFWFQIHRRGGQAPQCRCPRISARKTTGPRRVASPARQGREKPSFVPPGSDLPESEREAILATVKAENPGLGRWKNMLEPLCLAVLETRISQASSETGQRLLFADVEAAI